MSAPFLLIKKKGKDMEPVKIRFSRSLKTIMEDATQALRTPSQIQSLWDINGNVIDNIHSIQSGDVVICSLLRPDEEYDAFDLPMFKKQNSPSKESGFSQQSLSERSTKAKIPLPPDNVPKVPNISSPSSRNEPVDNSSSRVSSVFGEISQPSSVFPMMSQSMKSGLEKDDESVQQIQNLENFDKKSTSTVRSKLNEEQNDQISVQSTKSIKTETKSTIARHQMLMRLIKEQGRDIEYAETVNCYHNILEKIIGTIPEDHPKELDEKAIEILKKHTFICPGKSGIGTLQTKIGIIGPRHGGKSTFLNILAQKYLQFNYSQGLKRETCFFYFDFREMKDVVKNPLNFYKTFVKSILNQLIIQYPLLRLHPDRVQVTNESKETLNIAEMSQKTPVADEMIRTFLQYADRDTPISPLGPKFPRTPPFTSIANDIEQLRNRIQTSLESDDQMEPFFTNLFLLPKELAVAFGFDNVHYVVDHLDYLDVIVKPIDPFNKAAPAVNLVEFAKLMLSNGSFFVSSEDEERLSEILDKADEYSFDLYRGTELVTIVGLCKEESSLKEMKIAMEDGSDFIIKQTDCGGCSSFLSQWKAISESTDGLDPKSKAYSRSKMRILLHVRELLNDLIVDLNGIAADFTPVK